MSETKFKILIGILFYLIEIGILFVAYKSIYKKKMVSNRSLFDFFKMFISYFTFMFRYRSGAYEKNTELDDFLQENDELRIEMYTDIFGSIALFGILPYILVTLMHNDILRKLAVLFIVAGIIYFVYEIKERLPILLNRINQCQIFLYKFGRLKKYVVGNTERKRKRIKDLSAFLKVFWNSIKSLGVVRGIIWAFSLMCSIVLSILTFKEVFGKGIGNFLLEQLNPKTCFFFSPRMLMFEVPFITAILLLDWLDRAAEKGEYKEEACTTDNMIIDGEIDVQEGIIIYKKLVPWRDEIIRMCNCVGIREIICAVDDIGEKKIVSITLRNEIPLIIVNEDLFYNVEQSYNQEFFEVVKLMLAHEIVHICYHDSLPKHKEIRALIIFAFNYACLIGGAVVMAFIHNAIFEVIMSFWVIALILEIMIMINEKYWFQVMEFRADRIGMEISGASVEIFKQALQLMDSEEKSTEKSANIFQESYDRYVEVHIHPQKETRVYEVMRKKGWNMTDYVRYLFLIGRNVILRRGWRI